MTTQITVWSRMTRTTTPGLFLIPRIVLRVAVGFGIGKNQIQGEKPIWVDKLKWERVGEVQWFVYDDEVLRGDQIAGH